MVMPASPAEVNPQEEIEGSRLIDVAYPDVALNDVQFPHCLTHQPARSDCPDCMIAKRRHVRKLAGATTTVVNTYSVMITMDHSIITDGYGPNAIGGNQFIFCIKDRALNFGKVGLTKSIDG